MPRQSSLVDELVCTIEFEPKYRTPDALRGLEGFDYIWLIWGFSLNREQRNWQATVRPPRLGGNESVGVFASRSPYRPNPIGLSSVKLVSVDFENCLLTVSGADLVDGTPIYDIKPYVPYADSHPDAAAGFVDERKFERLEVIFPDELASEFSPEDARALKNALSLDPRPQYTDDPERIYGLEFAGRDVRFTVRGPVLTVCRIV